MPRLSKKESAKSSDLKLKRVLSFQDLLFLSIGSIIGSGWLFASLSAASVTGPAAVFSWIVGGILIMFIALTYAELGGAIPKSGGIVRYPHITHGAYAGYILGWIYLLSSVTVPAIEAEAVAEYASTYIPNITSTASTTLGPITVLTPTGILFAFGLLIMFFFVNYFGVRLLGKFNTFITWWKLILPAVTFIALFTVFHAVNFTGYGGFFPANVEAAKYGLSGLATMLYAIPTAGIAFAYLGFRQPIEFGGESKNPKRDIPLATIVAVLVALFVYTMLQTSFIGSINWSQVNLINSHGGVIGKIQPGDWAGLLSSNWSTGPFYNALTSAGVSALAAIGVLLLIDAWISPSGTGWIYTGNSARIIYGLSANNYLPSRFLRLSKYGIPYFALIASLVIGLLFLLPFPSWYILVGFISSASVLTYIMGGVGVETLRRTAPKLRRPFKLGAVKIIAPIATTVALLIVYWAGFETLFFLVTSLLIGMPLFLGYYASKKLKIRKTSAALLGIAELLIVLYLSYFLYNSVIVPSATTASPTLANISNWNTSFVLYFVLLSTAIAGITAILYRLSNKEGRKTIRSGLWLVALIFIVYAISFYGGFGVAHVISFPLDSVIIVAIGVAFHYIGVYSGFQTENLKEILRDQKRM